MERRKVIQKNPQRSMDPLDKVWAEFASKADKQNGKEKHQEDVKVFSSSIKENYVKISCSCIRS